MTITSMNENVIEFLRGDSTASVTFSQGKFVNKIKKLAKKYPNDCQIIAENEDGSIFARIPVKWVKINNPRREMTEEQKEEAAERLRRLRENREE